MVTSEAASGAPPFDIETINTFNDYNIATSYKQYAYSKLLLNLLVLYICNNYKNMVKVGGNGR